jgi:hypothetical protein
VKLRVIVEVVDETTRKGTRRRREVEIPARVLNIHSALCESSGDLRAFVANDVMSGALSAISGQQTATEALNEALLTEPSPAPAPQTPRNGRPAPKRHNKVESFLGLDVIEHMDGLDSRAAQMERARKAQEAALASAAGAPPPEPEMEWGVVGWGPDKGR